LALGPPPFRFRLFPFQLFMLRGPLIVSLTGVDFSLFPIPLCVQNLSGEAHLTCLPPPKRKPRYPPTPPILNSLSITPAFSPSAKNVVLSPFCPPHPFYKSRSTPCGVFFQEGSPHTTFPPPRHLCTRFPRGPSVLPF